MSIFFKSIKIACLSLLILLANSMSVVGQEFPNDPKTILKQWDYYKLAEKLGEGSQIIDTFQNQAYIAGMAYKEIWLSRPADVSYYFKDIDIASFQIKFFSPYLDERIGDKLTNVTDPVIRDSLLRVFQTQDSLRSDSVSRLLRFDPSLIEELNADALIKTSLKKDLYNLDSLRCDSLIEDITAIIGLPLRKGLTLHTERSARYFAVWVNKGIAISLRDFTDYTTIDFSIPFVNSLTASGFEIDPESEVLRKMHLSKKRDTLAISLLAVAQKKDLNMFRKASILVESQTGAKYVEKFHYNLSVKNLAVEAFDFNNDGVQEIWIHGITDSTTHCEVHQIYTVTNTEPIVIFDSKIETDEGLSLRLLHGFQAEVTLADGTSFMIPLKKTNNAIQGYYNSNGVLLANEILIPGGLQYLKSKSSDKDSYSLEGRLSIFTQSKTKHVCDLVITWDLVRGIWEVVDYMTIDQE
ncbi:MAG: hypothetical protein U9N86_17710 [Bacteroidota bacterium]|nr:hypothetical protein [Bacteroidota bacterium]